MPKKAKKSTKKTAKRAVKRTAKRTVKRAAKRTTKKTAKRAAKKTVKRTAKKAVKRTVKKAVKRPAKKAAAKPAPIGLGAPAPRPAATAFGSGMSTPSAMPMAPAMPKRTKAEHTVAVGDSLRLIALKYYGPGGQENWKVIYDANKAVIGENPYILKPGQVLKIPEL